MITSSQSSLTGAGHTSITPKAPKTALAEEAAAAENSAFLHDATQSVVIQRSSLDQATPVAVTAKTSSFDNAEEEHTVGSHQLGEVDGRSETQVSNVFVWGDNSHGQLAIRAEKLRQVPDPIAVNLNKLGRVCQVACGAAHTVFVAETGFIFAMGDNTHGQLGFSASSAPSSSQPMMVSGISPRPGRATAEVHCADHASFALVRAQRDADADEVFSWGSVERGILGRPATGGNARPSKIEFDEVSDRPLKVKQMSVGADHAAVVTPTSEVLVWGANNAGQLGLGDTSGRPTPVRNGLVQAMGTAQMSCGKSFSFLISGQNEIMVSGRLPFTVQTDQGEELDYIFTF